MLLHIGDPSQAHFSLFVMKSLYISVFTDDDRADDEQLSDPDYVSWEICEL